MFYNRFYWRKRWCNLRVPLVSSQHFCKSKIQQMFHFFFSVFKQSPVVYGSDPDLTRSFCTYHPHAMDMLWSQILTGPHTLSASLCAWTAQGFIVICRLSAEWNPYVWTAGKTLSLRFCFEFVHWTISKDSDLCVILFYIFTVCVEQIC